MSKRCNRALASAEFPPFGSSKKTGLTRFGGVRRNPRTKAAYSQIQPPSKPRNQLLECYLCARSKVLPTCPVAEPRTPGGLAGQICDRTSANAVNSVSAVRPTVSRLRRIITAISVSTFATAPNTCRHAEDHFREEDFPGIAALAALLLPLVLAGATG
jgi:hypothetical protein